MLGVKQALSKDAPEDMVDVLCATTDIQAGALLTEENTEFRQLPPSACVPGLITEREQIEDRALRVRAVAGEYIMMQKLGEKGQVGAATEIPEGMRVVTISVDATKSHSGLLLPGNRVDVICTYKIRTAQGMITKTKAILQYIAVFATDTLRDGMDSEAQTVNSKNVSLLVTFEQAALVMQAQNKGQLTLAMRGAGDDVTVDQYVVDESVFEGSDEHAMVNTDDVAEDGDIRRALEEEQVAQQIEEPVVEEEEPVEPEENMWVITIYEGEEVRYEQVALPQEEPASGLLDGLIRKYFSSPPTQDDTPAPDAPTASDAPTADDPAVDSVTAGL